MFCPRRQPEFKPPPSGSITKQLPTKKDPLEEQLVNHDTLKRHDLRFPEQLRHNNLHMGVLSKAAGSALLECGGSDIKLLVAVAPPRPALGSRIFKALGSVECRVRGSAVLTDDSKYLEMAQILADTFSAVIRREAYPNSYIMMDVFIVSSGDLVYDRFGAMASAITAGSAALIEAGIEMIATACGTSFGLPDSSLLLMDPTEREVKLIMKEGGAVGMVAVAFAAGQQRIAQFVSSGAIEDPSLLSTAINHAVEGCQAVLDSCLRPAIERKAEKGK